MNILHSSGVLLFLLSDPSNAATRPETPTPVGGRTSLSVPTAPEEACQALVTCDTLATLLAEGDWNDRIVGYYLAANESAAFATAPPDYPRTDSIKVFTQRDNAWLQAPSLSANGFIGDQYHILTEDIAAGGKLLVVGSALGTSIFRCAGVGCAPHGTINAAAYAVSTNGEEVALGLLGGITWLYSQAAPGEWIRTAIVNGPYEENCTRVLLAMDEGRLAVASCHRVQMFVEGGSNWSFEQELAWPGLQIAVRALALKGSHVLVGAPDQCIGTVCESVYAFDLVNGNWQPAQHIIGPAPNPYAGFGANLVISDEYAIIGASGQPYPGWSAFGAVHAFRRSAEQWVLARTIIPPFRDNFTLFGFSLAVLRDKLMVGAPAADCAGNCNGQVYAYDLTDDDCDCDGVADVCEVDEDQDGVIACDACPESIVDPFVAFGDCVTEVRNLVFEDGCSMADALVRCAEAEQEPAERRCVNRLMREWRRQGLIDVHDAQQIRRCLRSSGPN